MMGPLPSDLVCASEAPLAWTEGGSAAAAFAVASAAAGHVSAPTAVSAAGAVVRSVASALHSSSGWPSSGGPGLAAPEASGAPSPAVQPACPVAAGISCLSLRSPCSEEQDVPLPAAHLGWITLGRGNVVPLFSSRSVVFRSGARYIVFWTSGLLVATLFAFRTVAFGVVRRPCFFGRHGIPAPQFSGTSSSRHSWLAMVFRRALLRVITGSFPMLNLCRHSFDVSFTRSPFFLRCGTCRDPSVAAVVANAVHGRVMNDRRVVNIMDVGDIHIGDRAVVEETAVVPTPALKAGAKISES